jgi:hypothetical protein
MTVTDALKQAAYAQQTDEVFVTLVTLSSDELTESIRICDDPTTALTGLGDDVYGIVSNGDTFLFMPYDIWLPRDDKTGTVSARLAIQNTDRRIVEVARTVTRPVNVKMQVVLASDPDTIEVEFDNFQLSNVKYDVMKVEGDLTLNYWGLEPFPSSSFTPSNFPGLF